MDYPDKGYRHRVVPRSFVRQGALFSVAPCWRSPMWRSQAEAEGLTLLKADNKAGYYGVKLAKSSKSKPYEAQVKRAGTMVYLGGFATAEEAALCVARSPEGRAAAERAAAARLLTSEGAEVVEVLEAEEVQEETENVQMVEVVAVMVPEVVVDASGRSTGRPKRRRNA